MKLFPATLRIGFIREIDIMKSGARTLLAILSSSMFAGFCIAGDIVGNVAVDGIRSAASIVVYVDGLPALPLDPSAPHAAVHQEKMTFIPHVLAVVQGTTVDFWNDDVVKHGVSWPSIGGNKKLAHYLGVWPQGEMRSFTFNDLGDVPLLCALHPEMSGYIIVVPTPYFAVTDDGGNFTIKNVPAGEYKLKTWSEEGEPVVQLVHVTEATAPINVTVRHTSRR